MSFMSPGRNPSFSPASTAGRDRIILRISLFFNALTARAMLVYVLPEPAGPVANTMSHSEYALTSDFWLGVRAVMGFPVTP